LRVCEEYVQIAESKLPESSEGKLKNGKPEKQGQKKRKKRVQGNFFEKGREGLTFRSVDPLSGRKRKRGTKEIESLSDENLEMN